MRRSRPSRTSRLVAVVGALCVLVTPVAPAVAQARSSKAPPLYATAGERSVSLRTPAGAIVRNVRSRTFVFVVSDRSRRCNFHLVGPNGSGVDRHTSLPFVGRTTWTLTLKPGIYTYRCDRSGVNRTHILRVV